MNKIIFVTGATSGFGKACAQKFAANGYNIIINGRRKERLEELKINLEKEFSIKVLALDFDVRNKKTVFSSIENIPDDWKKIDVLINNAGLALGRDFFENADIDNWQTMLDTK